MPERERDRGAFKKNLIKLSHKAVDVGLSLT